MAGTNDEQPRPGQSGDYRERSRWSQRLQNLRDNMPVTTNQRLSRSRSLPLDQYEYMEHPQQQSQTPTALSDLPVREAEGIAITSSDTPAEDTRVPVDNRATMVAGSDHVAALPTVSLTGLGGEQADQQCVLCRNTYNADPVILPCKHVFDKKCLLSWLSEDEANQNTCPMCRRQLFRKRNLGNGGNGVYTEADFEPLMLHDELGYPDYGERRARIALQRRIGALRDREQYELLRDGGASLPAVNRPERGVLDTRQDYLLFQELQNRGAFALPGMNLQFRAGRPDISDQDIYEILRDSGANWCITHGRWRVGGVHQRFGGESAEDEGYRDPDDERQEQEERSSNLQNLVGVVRRAWNSL